MSSGSGFRQFHSETVAGGPADTSGGQSMERAEGARPEMRQKNTERERERVTTDLSAMAK